jgi:hypothetical protein
MKTEIQHIALNYSNKKKADIFFKEILGLKIIKSFAISKELSKQIFNIIEACEVVVYGNNSALFEIFITKNKSKIVFDHICIKVENIEDFIENCKKHDLQPNFINQGDKKLLFVKDFSDNLFEIK